MIRQDIVSISVDLLDSRRLVEEWVRISLLYGEGGIEVRVVE